MENKRSQAALAALCTALSNGTPEKTWITSLMAQAFISGMEAANALSQSPEAGQQVESTMTL